ncbi:MAG: acetolactate synthase small subunit [Clostridiaceae bacterium]|nr:acetolactate synthase small subunit [Clostridiaceae bacterium]
MNKRWISLFVENEVGVLARVAGLFSGKLYNLDSLTVGETEDRTISRMTIGCMADDQTFEQILKQLNRMVEVIKVIDFTDVARHTKEILFVRINNCDEQDKTELFRIEKVFDIQVIDYDKKRIEIQSVQSSERNDELIALLNRFFLNRIEVVRGGSVAIEALNSLT